MPHVICNRLEFEGLPKTGHNSPSALVDTQNFEFHNMGYKSVCLAPQVKYLNPAQ